MCSSCNTWTRSSQRLNNSLKVTQFRVTLALKQDFSCVLVLASIPVISDFTPARRLRNRSTAERSTRSEVSRAGLADRLAFRLSGHSSASFRGARDVHVMHRKCAVA